MRHALKFAGASSGLVAVVLGAWYWWAGWSDRSELGAARRELSIGRHASARERLARLSARRPGRGEVELPLGDCEQAAGRIDAAVAAWSRVPPDSPQGPDAALRLAEVWMDDGRYSKAEVALKKALERPSGQVLDLRQLLIQLYWHEGRLEEARKLVEQNFVGQSEAAGPTAPTTLMTLHGLVAIDFETHPVDQIHQKLADLAARAPDDDRLWLARANVAVRSGRLDEAGRLLEDCLRRRPDDPAVWLARLDHALAAELPEAVEEAVAHLKVGDLPRAAAYRVAAWIARKRDDPASERRALENLLADDRSNCAAIERLAELELATGQNGKAFELRKRKAEVDAAKLDYRRLAQTDYKKTAGEILPLAERLGRTFEAFAFFSIANNRRPSQTANHPIYGRIGRVGVDPVLAPDQPLADFIGLDRIARKPSPTPRLADDRGPTPTFEERASASGLAFTYLNGRSPLRQLPETMSGGLAVLDFDGDGWLDVYAVQGGTFPPDPAAPHDGDRLFRNRRDGTFEDVTERAIPGPRGQAYGLGVAVGDYDNDGRPDLFVTRWRSYRLLRNKGDGTFEDATDRAGLGGDRDWPTSAAFADVDNDGDLDLYVCHYLDWDTANPRPCRDGNGAYSYCEPRIFPALPDHAFRNDGGTFVDVTKEAGLVELDGRGLGVVAADLNDDGLVEIFVANDGTANLLFGNRGGFKFEEVGLSSGVAGNAEGGFQAGMGIACGDLDGDGLPDLVVTNFYGESSTFFQNLGGGMFGDRTAGIGLASSSRTMLGFGTALFDANNDGHLDLATANGHVNDFRPIFPYAMPTQLLLGGRSGRFRNATDSAGPAWSTPRVGRGLAQADLDNDGRMDLLVLPQDAPLVYLHQVAPEGSKEKPRALTLRLEGTKSNRDAVGARVTIRADGRSQVAQRTGGGSYQSSGDPRLHFGLGSAKTVDEVEVRWPSGLVETHRGLAAGGYHLREGDSTAKPLPGF